MANETLEMLLEQIEVLAEETREARQDVRALDEKILELLEALARQPTGSSSP